MLWLIMDGSSGNRPPATSEEAPDPTAHLCVASSGAPPPTEDDEPVLQAVNGPMPRFMITEKWAN